MATPKHTTQKERPIVRTEAETARRIHKDLKPRTLERWRRLGTGPRFVRIGRRVGYTDDAIDEWLEQQSRNTTAQK
jgi:hypothetical protein